MQSIKVCFSFVKENKFATYLFIVIEIEISKFFLWRFHLNTVWPCGGSEEGGKMSVKFTMGFVFCLRVYDQ